MPDAALASLRAEFGYRFVTLARRWRRVIDHKLAESGLTDVTWAPLMHLSRSGDGISQTELAARAGLDTSTMVRLIDLLSTRGLVERRIDPADRRARLIFLTPAAGPEIARIRAQLDRIESDLLADLDASEVAAMMAGFDAIATRAEAMLAADRTGAPT